jgi:predicted regulator of amino acid metabolism with ACT domain
MEELPAGWLKSLASQGPGWTLFCLTAVVAGTVIYWLVRQLREEHKQSRADQEKMTKALTEATEVNRQIVSVQQERVQTDKELGSIVNALIKQAEVTNTLAGERAVNIQNTMRDLAGQILAEIKRLFEQAMRRGE